MKKQEFLADHLIKTHLDLIDELKLGKTDKSMADAIALQSSKILSVLRLQKDLIEMIDKREDTKLTSSLNEFVNNEPELLPKA